MHQRSGRQSARLTGDALANVLTDLGFFLREFAGATFRAEAGLCVRDFCLGEASRSLTHL